MLQRLHDLQVLGRVGCVDSDDHQGPDENRCASPIVTPRSLYIAWKLKEKWTSLVTRKENEKTDTVK